MRLWCRMGLFAAVLVASFVLGTRDNHFSWLYHNDESSKVVQVMTGQRNFNHPPLMLEVADGVGMVVGAGTDPQRTVQVGRDLSAFYLGFANALWVDLALVFGGLPVALALAAVLLAQPEFFEIAHYFKEDTLLLFGLATSFWVLAFYGQEPNRRRGLMLGVALAFLGGSKYVGWFWVVLIAARAAGWSWRHERASLGWMAGAFAAVTLLIYFPALRNFEVWRMATHTEVTFLLEGDYGTGLAVPHSLYWRDLFLMIQRPFVVLGALSLLAAGIKRRPPGSLVLVVSSLVLLIAMSWTAKYSDRYVLPVGFLLSFAVVVGPVLCLQRLDAKLSLRAPFSTKLAAAVVAILIAFCVCRMQWPAFTQRVTAFHSDGRSQLESWMAANLPGKISLAQDEMARLYQLPNGQWTTSCWFVADLGPLEKMRRAGYTHVLISYDVYHRYVDGSVPQTDVADFHRRRDFYEQLMKEGKLLWQEDNFQPKTLHPGLSLYEIRQ